MLNWYMRINRIFNVVNEGTMEKKSIQKILWLAFIETWKKHNKDQGIN